MPCIVEWAACTYEYTVYMKQDKVALPRRAKVELDS